MIRMERRNGGTMLKIIHHFKFAVFCLLVLLTSAGCGGPKSLIVVMPDPSGKVGKVEVVNQKGSVVLDQPWQATEVASLDKMPGEPKVLDEKQVKEIFREAIEARPEAPVTYRIYFKNGGMELTPESDQAIRAVMKASELRNPHEISISGHTDAVGSIEFNRTLSLKRAQEIASVLVSRGVKRDILEITYHGKENPLIRTPEGVAEPMNRRVEITIR
jgi:outer membrane protein OmpA-like peptidoglycan-associated protein